MMALLVEGNFIWPGPGRPHLALHIHGSSVSILAHALTGIKSCRKT